jgi:hypothetical protein
MGQIRLRTQFPNVNFTVCEDGRLLLNGAEVGRLFPDEYHLISVLAEESQERQRRAA